MKIDLRKIDLYVISLETAHERRSHIKQEFTEKDLTPTIIDAVEDETGLIGCSKSHIKALSLGLKSNKPFAVFEDDISINHDAPMEFDIPDHTDAVYLGISTYYDQGLPNKDGPLLYLLNKQYGKIQNMLSGHGILYLNPMYVEHTLRICEFSIKTVKAHDIYLSMTQQFFNVLAFIHPVVYQDATFNGQEEQTNDTLERFVKSPPLPPTKMRFACRNIAIILSITGEENIDEYIYILQILRLQYFLIIFCHNSDQTEFFTKMRKHDNLEDMTRFITDDICNLSDISSTDDTELFAIKYVMNTNHHKYLVWIPACTKHTDTWKNIINDLPNYLSQYPERTHIFWDSHSAKESILTVFNTELPISPIIDTQNDAIYRLWFIPLLNQGNIVNNIREIRIIAEKTHSSEKWRIVNLMCKQIITEQWEKMTGKDLVAIFIEWILTGIYDDNDESFAQIRHYFNKLYNIYREFYINTQDEQFLQDNLLHIGGPVFLSTLCLPKDESQNSPQDSPQDYSINLERYTSEATIFIEFGEHPSGIIKCAQGLFRKVHCTEKSQDAFCTMTGTSSNIQIGYHNNITLYRGDPQNVLPTVLAVIDDNVVFLLRTLYIKLLSEIDKQLTVKAIVIYKNTENTKNIKQLVTQCKITRENSNNGYTVLYIEPPEIITCGILIFSKDRPLQLSALLDSLSAHVPQKLNVNVLYLASNELGQKCYNNVHQSYPQHTFIKEYNFYTQILDIISNYTYILFLVDDSLLVREFSLDNCINLMEENNDILGVSLRLGKNTTHCYTLDKSNPLPEISRVIGSFQLYDWQKAIGADYSYSLEISSSIFRSRDILTIIKDTPTITKPNVLEDVLAQNRKLIHRPLLAMYTTSVAFAVPYNIVQTTHTNRNNDNKQTSVENFLLMYNLGMRIDISRYYHYISSACHELVDLYLITTDNV